MSELLDPSEPAPLPADDDPPILLLTPGLAQSPVIFTPVDPPPTVGSSSSAARLVSIARDTSVHPNLSSHNSSNTAPQVDFAARPSLCPRSHPRVFLVHDGEPSTCVSVCVKCVCLFCAVR